MNSELKFRAWDKKAKKYYQVTDLRMGDSGYHKTANNLNNPSYGYGQEYDTGYEKFYPSEVIIEQYVGRKDKNGKEIYAGDIFKDKHYGIVYIEYMTTLACFGIWQDKAKNLGCPMHHINRATIEIIGNIHKNPELLEEERS